MWHFNRPRSDGGYDAISIVFDENRRPLFDAVINVIKPEGLHQPWGERVAAQDAVAFAPLTRVLIQKRKYNAVVVSLLRWLGFNWFGFSASSSAEKNLTLATQACDEFLSCLDQAERWWATGQLGPNLVKEEIGIPNRDMNSAPHGQPDQLKEPRAKTGK